MMMTERSEDVRVGMVDGLVELREAIAELDARAKGVEHAWRRMGGCKLEVECEKTGGPELLGEALEAITWVGSRIQALHTATMAVIQGNVRVLGKHPGVSAETPDGEGAK